MKRRLVKEIKFWRKESFFLSANLFNDLKFRFA